MNDPNNRHYDNSVLFAGVDQEGFRMAGPNDLTKKAMKTFLRIVDRHGDRLRALLDKPVLVHMAWSDGDRQAFVTVLPAGEPPKNETSEQAERRSNEPFHQFHLPIR